MPSTPSTWNIAPSTVKKPRQLPNNIVINSTSRKSQSHSTAKKPRAQQVVSQAVAVNEMCNPNPNKSTPMSHSLNYQLSTRPVLKKFKSNSAFMGNCYSKLSQDQQSILKAIRDGDMNVLYKYKVRGMSFDF